VNQNQSLDARTSITLGVLCIVSFVLFVITQGVA